MSEAGLPGSVPCGGPERSGSATTAGGRQFASPEPGTGVDTRPSAEERKEGGGACVFETVLSQVKMPGCGPKVLPGVGLASSLSTQSGRDCRLTLAWRSPQFPREVLAAAGTESAAFPWGAPSPRGQPHAPRLEADAGGAASKLRKCWKGGTRREPEPPHLLIHLNLWLTVEPRTHGKEPQVCPPKFSSWRWSSAATSPAAHCVSPTK